MKIEDLIQSLPDPEKDEMPPRVGFTKEGYEQAMADKAQKRAFLNPKKDTETRVKYVLNKLLGTDLTKDGDWVTVAGGRDVWQKKISDYVGGIPVGGSMLALYVEVKGVSPYRNFQLGRLDKRNNPSQPSQHEKLTTAMEKGYTVWLALGFWDAKPHAVPVKQFKNGRQYTKWYRVELDLVIYLIDWKMWLNVVLPELGDRRSLRQKDRQLVRDAAIYKNGNRWELHPQHWLHSSPLLQDRASLP